MNSEKRVCQNCQKEFTIEPEDFQFYEKIKVPPPTWCPECRMERRTTFYPNVFARLFKRKCDATGKNLISIYPFYAPYKVYERIYWHSDGWDPLSYGLEYDFSTPFFRQFNKLQRVFPRYHTYNVNSINCEYCTTITNSKNCYLTNGRENEDCCYSVAFKNKNCIDCWFTIQCDSCYFCINSEKCFRVAFGHYANNCMESAFLYDCSNCSYCFGCINLRNKSYHIFNKPYSKSEYFRILKNYNLGSYFQYRELSQKFVDFKLSNLFRFAKIFNSINVLGDHLRNTKNCHYCFDTLGVENCKYVAFAGLGLNKSYDVVDAGTNSSLLYEAGGAGRNLYKSSFLNWVVEGSGVYYSDLCENCSNIFGCVGLRNKQYCILNKQYTKEEYEKLVPEIIEHMNKMPYIDKKGRVYKYGEFFPPELSPFCYNETIAQEYFPLTKEQALKQGYSWKDPEERDYQIDIKTEELPDHIKDVPDSIVDKVIQCQHANLLTYEINRLEPSCNEQCTTAFRIIEPELQFYKRMNLPLPRLCPNCRHYQRLKQRNPLKLWHRKCQCAGEKSENGVYKNTIEHFHGKEPCPNEFETTYSPDRPEIVYCEACYLAEVV